MDTEDVAFSSDYERPVPESPLRRVDSFRIAPARTPRRALAELESNTPDRSPRGRSAWRSDENRRSDLRDVQERLVQLSFQITQLSATCDMMLAAISGNTKVVHEYKCPMCGIVSSYVNGDMFLSTEPSST